ncbi:MAG: hypothetical protein GC185_03070 [Alphaproteobacteria bacterium]|nr:hypothetical protein [Alphaproteobacteria bacterium]
MGSLVGVLFFVGGAVLWAFFAFQPEYANKKQLRAFNWSVIGALAMIILAWAANMAVLLSPEQLQKFRTPFLLIGSLGIESIFLAVMFVLRNFWIFKPPKRPGGFL